MKLLISPHNDDLVLWTSFTALREKPLVVTVLDSYIQPARGYSGCSARERRGEDLRAAAILGVDMNFFGFRDDSPDWDGIEARLREYGQPEAVYAPAFEDGGHAHHNEVALIAKKIWPTAISYLTYTRAGKSTNGTPVPYEPDWPRTKLQALTMYESQIRLAATAPHFLRGLEEYVAA